MFKNPMSEIKKALCEQLQTAGFMIERDAKKNCPVDTGNLRASIHTKMEESELACYVGTNVEYAVYVEEGTSRQKAQPFLMPAAEQNKEAINNLFRGLI